MFLQNPHHHAKIDCVACSLRAVSALEWVALGDDSACYRGYNSCHLKVKHRYCGKFTSLSGCLCSLRWSWDGKITTQLPNLELCNANWGRGNCGKAIYVKNIFFPLFYHCFFPTVFRNQF